MSAARVVIVGGGLSGLYAAYMLEQKGWHDYVLLEARETVGGRVLALPSVRESEVASSCFDLGPTWFWPSMQPRLGEVIAELGLGTFDQYASGDLLLERAEELVPHRVASYYAQEGRRVLGGMSALIDALRKRVDRRRIHTGQRVRSLWVSGDEIDILSEEATGLTRAWHARHVLIAMPPRLASATLDFAPSLPPELSGRWQTTATWMAPHAKYVAVYEKPFWRARGLSGEARSARGPLAEIHDASMPGAQAALFGFFGIPAQVRAGVPDDKLRAHCRAQLSRLFGPEAGTPVAEGLKDWSSDSLTSTASDLTASSIHALSAPAFATAGPWQGRMTGIGSEWSHAYPGYLAGAIDAAERGVQAL
ncbi:flavin monoamine oxidase family protein [Paraburkholderia sp. J10-1]|uniref:flavin monoamine oxidase family protein n=1 Tax=Paraburkholderia sp. J10-1 TaxID=2805430 RepID=UPI002AB740ED|nr:FAD-dependent oxidoreductase [Paraburkholderia sp. J10-1]